MASANMAIKGFAGTSLITHFISEKYAPNDMAVLWGKTPNIIGDNDKLIYSGDKVKLDKRLLKATMRVT